MPRDSAGNYSLVAGNPVQSGEIVSSTWANNTLNDVSTALSDSLDRNGRGGMLAPFRFADGTNLLPGASWVNENTTGFYRFDGGDLRIAVLTADIMRWNAAGAQLYNSSTLAWDAVAVVGGSGTVPDGTDGQTLRYEASTSEWQATSAAVIDDSGVTTVTSLVATTADINAGTVDAVIGGTTPAAGTFTTITGTTFVGIPDSSLTVSGIIELATQAEVDAGTDALRAVTSATLASWTGGAETDTLATVTTRGATTTNAITVGGFTSTGIDDNATSTAITIDSDERVGVNITPTNRTFEVKAIADAQIVASFETGSGVAGRIAIADANTTADSSVGIGSSGDNLSLYAGAAVRATLSSAGNLSVTGNLTCLGIDDNATSTAISIDSAGIVSGTWSDHTAGNSSAKMMKLTQAQYDALTPDTNTMYFIVG